MRAIRDRSRESATTPTWLSAYCAGRIPSPASYATALRSGHRPRPGSTLQTPGPAGFAPERALSECGSASSSGWRLLDDYRHPQRRPERVRVGTVPFLYKGVCIKTRRGRHAPLITLVFICHRSHFDSGMTARPDSQSCQDESDAPIRAAAWAWVYPTLSRSDRTMCGLIA